MPAEILGEVLVGVVRAVCEVVFELVVRGTGWVICRAFGQHVDPEGGWATCVGLVVWLAIAIAVIEVRQRL